ncbi:MAG: Asp-tRNA(Asn)/Glu-tRNA(Gln) amidotransferase subunit GatB [Eubacteriaceae bacterium]|nr:Asp-tRNA(Asn)/Glu-tRNA(Gln) amidotransferase subunit GatB [Eubacteriaceae bacterium]
MKYETVIGLEIHCELKTSSKIFCSCKNEFGGEENEHTCPGCLGMPGILPVLNEKAVELAVRAGIALNCTIQRASQFDRKNYFYADLSKGYQISQYFHPICTDGWLDIPSDSGEQKRVRIARIHIEEDAGKIVHKNGMSYLDDNRSSLPLIEIVTMPDMRSPAEAERFARKARAILKAAGVSDCRMQEGSLRFDVNLSIMPQGSTVLGTRTEMKNLNSFRSLARAAENESARHQSVLEGGGSLFQETRRWDDEKGMSFGMRSKENAQDYRYFPDPDLTPIELDDAYIENIKLSMPELPEAKMQRYIGLGASEKDAEMLSEALEASELFEGAYAESGNAKLTASLITGDIAAKVRLDSLEGIKFTPSDLGRVVKMSEKGEISLSAARKTIAEMIEYGGSPDEIVKRLGLSQISDESAIRQIVSEVLEANPKSVADIKSGKSKAIGFIVGQAMKISKGAANPALVNRIIAEILEL